MKRKTDGVAVAAGILLAVCALLAVSRFAVLDLKAYSTWIKNGREVYSIVWKSVTLILHVGFFAFASVVCFARLRGKPALVACAIGAAEGAFQITSSSALAAVNVIKGTNVTWSGFATALVGYLCLSAECMFLLVLTLPDAKRKTRPKWMRVLFFLPALTRIAEVFLTGKASSISEGVKLSFAVLSQIDQWGARLAWQVSQHPLFTILTLLAGAAAFFLFALWLTKREEPALEPVEA